MTDPRSVDGDTYEMFWDCKYCRTPKLLGLTHRHCPVCGAPQNAAERYFPSEAEKVRVADHRYVGRDLVCKHCGTYNSRNSQHCRDCGAPTAEGSDAQVLADLPSEPPKPQGLAATAPKARPKPWLRKVIIRGLVLAVIAFVALVFLWKKEQSFEVTGQSWERKIDIERFGPVRESTWCDQLPSNVRELRRYRAVRSHEQVPDGETCTTRRVDQGDGTFREVKDCKPRYKTRDIEDNRCDYEINRWSVARSVQASGAAMTPPPSWPALPALSACSHVGCERAGAKRETYRVQLRAPDGDSESCEVDSGRWARMGVGQRFRANVRVMGGGVDCSSLTAQ